MRVLVPALATALLAAGEAGLLPCGPGIAVESDRRLVLDGRFLLDQGPPDGLELLATLPGGRLHEALIELEARDALVIKAAALVAFDLADGSPPEPDEARPACGTPLAIVLRWIDPASGLARSAPAAALVRDRIGDRPLPPWPWVWSGSAVGAYADGNGGVRHALHAAEDGCIIALHDENGSSLIAAPTPHPRDDLRWEVNSALAPPAGTRVAIEIAPCPLLPVAGGAPAGLGVAPGSPCWRPAGGDAAVIALPGPPPPARARPDAPLPATVLLWLAAPPASQAAP